MQHHRLGWHGNRLRRSCANEGKRAVSDALLLMLVQARPASAESRKDGEGNPVSTEEAVAAAEEEWSGRLNSALALNQDLEARVAELQKQGSRMRRSAIH